MHAELPSEVLIVLTFAVVAVALFRQLHLPAVVGYMAVGILVGPHGLNLLAPSELTRFLAELGIVFLMFYVGLEFSLPKVRAAKRTVLGGGGAQVLTTSILFGAAAYGLGQPATAAVLIGGALAMSSTAIGLKQLVEQAELNTAHGRMVVGILLFQDVATLPFLVALNVFAGSGDGLAIGLGLALVKAAVVFVLLIVAGRYLLTRAIAWVAKSRSAELFMLAALLIVLGASFIASTAGLSLPLGAFLAGMLIGDTEFKHQVEDDIRPFRDVLLGVFFVTIGLQLDPTVLIAYGPIIALLVLALMVMKGLIVSVIAYRAGREWSIAARTGIVLAHSGEFSLLIISLALARGLLDTSTGQILLASVILSMAAAPLLIRYNGIAVRWLMASWRPVSAPGSEDRGLTDHIVLCGFGRVGRHLTRLFQMAAIPCAVIENDPGRLREAKAGADRVIYGDATRAKILAAAELGRARALVITFDRTEPALKVVRRARALSPELPLIVSAATEQDLDDLMRAGASLALPENLEAGLALGTEILLLAGIPPEQVRHAIVQLRSDLHPSLRPSEALLAHGPDLASADSAAVRPDGLRPS